MNARQTFTTTKYVYFYRSAVSGKNIPYAIATSFFVNLTKRSFASYTENSQELWSALLFLFNLRCWFSITDYCTDKMQVVFNLAHMVCSVSQVTGVCYLKIRLVETFTFYHIYSLKNTLVISTSLLRHLQYCFFVSKGFSALKFSFRIFPVSD